MGLGLKGIATALNNMGPDFLWGGDFPGGDFSEGGDFSASKWDREKVAVFMDNHYLAHDPDVDRKKIDKRIGALLDTGLSHDEVAEIMNCLGFLTANGRTFKGASIKYICNKVGLKDG